MKITTYASFQMTDTIGEYIPLEENSYEYTGPIAQAGKSGGSSAAEDMAIIEQAKTGQMSRAQSERMFSIGEDKEGYWQDFFDTNVLDNLNQVTAQSMPAMQEWYAQSGDTLDRYNTLFKPLEDSLAQDAADYASPWRREQEAGAAAADVGQAFEAERENTRRRLEDYGVDPSQTRAAALDADVSMNEALGKAGAMNAARQRVDTQQDMYRAQAIDLGLSNQAQGQASFAQGLGSDTLRNQGTVANIGKSLLGSGLDYTAQGAGLLGSNISSNQSMAQIASAGAEREQSARNANTQAAGGVASAALMYAAMSGVKDGGSADNLSRYAIGGEVQGPGGPRQDAIPAQLSDGEFVIDAETVKRKGTAFFENLMEKEKAAAANSRMEMQQRQEGIQQNRAEGAQQAIGIMAQQQGIPPQQFEYGGYAGTPVIPLADGGIVNPSDDIARAVPAYIEAIDTQYLGSGGSLGTVVKDIFNPKNLISPKRLLETTKKYSNPMAPFERDDPMNPLQLLKGDSDRVKQDAEFMDAYNVAMAN